MHGVDMSSIELCKGEAHLKRSSGSSGSFALVGSGDWLKSLTPRAHCCQPAG